MRDRTGEPVEEIQHDRGLRPRIHRRRRHTAAVCHLQALAAAQRRLLGRRPGSGREWRPTVTASQPVRYLVGGPPRSVVIDARTARLLVSLLGADLRRVQADGAVHVDVASQLEALVVAGEDWKRYVDFRRKSSVTDRQAQSPSCSRELTTAEAAGRLGLSQRQVVNIAATQLGGHRVRGRWLLDEQAVADVVRQRHSVKGRS